MTRERLFLGWLLFWFVAGLRLGLLMAAPWVMFSATGTLALYYLCLLIRDGYRKIRWAFCGSSDQEVDWTPFNLENRPE